MKTKTKASAYRRISFYCLFCIRYRITKLTYQIYSSFIKYSFFSCIWSFHQIFLVMVLLLSSFTGSSGDFLTEWSVLVSRWVGTQVIYGTYLRLMSQRGTFLLVVLATAFWTVNEFMIHSIVKLAVVVYFILPILIPTTSCKP